MTPYHLHYLTHDYDDEMSRLPRIIVPGIPHHLTQRGNRRQRVFLVDDDYSLYKDWLAKSCRQNGVAVWSYCLMPNHVHLILVPADATGLSRAIGETHRRYSSYINARLRVTGHLFQGRFGSVAMRKTGSEEKPGQRTIVSNILFDIIDSKPKHKDMKHAKKTSF
jgi:REP element-mobilizing transposase RayT